MSEPNQTKKQALNPTSVKTTGTKLGENTASE